MILSWDEHLQYDLFSVEFDVKPEISLNNHSSIHRIISTLSFELPLTLTFCMCVGYGHGL